MGLWRHRETERPSLTLYYASDIHGSDRLWRKFLRAGSFYGADALIMGGDLVGKAIVPIERRPDGTHRAVFLGEERLAASDDELDQLIEAIRFNGFYPWIAPSEEVARHAAREAEQGELFDRVVREDLERWIALADSRGPENGARPFVMAGNDDPWFVDELLARARSLVLCDDRVVRVGDREMISCSYANRTPWDSPRELDEDELYARLDRMASKLEEPRRAIFNLHVPPYDSGLDTATELRPDLTPVFRGGQPAQIPVGSRAVRQIIEEYQPAVALHGHIHESRGEARIGRTLALNPGSEYNTGRLHGVVVKLGADSVLSHQFVVG